MLRTVLQPFLDTLSPNAAHTEILKQLCEGQSTFTKDVQSFRVGTEKEHLLKQSSRTASALSSATKRMSSLAEASRDLVKNADLLYKLTAKLIDVCEKDMNARDSELWVTREIMKARKAADTTRQIAVEHLKLVRYFHKQAAWLTERFPKGELRNVEGLIKLVDKKELKANDWSLTPGRYVGVAPEEVDEDFDLEEELRNIHVELEGLNTEAAELAEKIARNFEELGI